MASELNNMTDMEAQAALDTVEAALAANEAPEAAAMGSKFMSGEEAAPERSAPSNDGTRIAVSVAAEVVAPGVGIAIEAASALGSLARKKKSDVDPITPSKAGRKADMDKKAGVKPVSLAMPGEVKNGKSFKNGPGLVKKNGGDPEKAEVSSKVKLASTSLGARVGGIKIPSNDERMSPQRKREVEALKGALSRRLEKGMVIAEGAQELTRAQYDQLRTTGDDRLEDKIKDYASDELKDRTAKFTGNEQLKPKTMH